jgi:hypothetical protein
MVDFGSGQGRSEFATAGVAALRRGLQRSENAGLGRKMPFLDGHEVTIKIPGPYTMGLFEDTCGNLINLVQLT